MADEPTGGAAATSEGAPAGTAPETLAGGKPAGGSGDQGTKPAGGDKPAEGDKGKAGTTPSDGKGGESPKGKDGDQGQPKAPDKFALKMPEGGRLTNDDLSRARTLAAEMGWTEQQTQAHLEAHADAIHQQSEAFLEETQQDPTYGGKHLEQTQQLALKALDRVRPKGTPRGDGFRQLLNRSGYGNNLEVISFLADLGKMMAEDSPTGGGTGGAAKDRDAVSVLYPDQNEG